MSDSNQCSPLTQRSEHDKHSADVCNLQPGCHTHACWNGTTWHAPRLLTRLCVIISLSTSPLVMKVLCNNAISCTAQDPYTGRPKRDADYCASADILTKSHQRPYSSSTILHTFGGGIMRVLCSHKIRQCLPLALVRYTVSRHIGAL